MAVLHITFALVFLWITAAEVTDSSNYAAWSELGWAPSWFGTDAIVNLVVLLRLVGIKSYFNQLLVFAGVSFVGLAASYVATSRVLRRNQVVGWQPWILRLAFLLPGLHFWTVPVGKDSVVAFAYGLVVLGAIGTGKSRVLATLSGSVIVLMVRPHVGICIVLLLGVYLARVSLDHKTLAFRTIVWIVLTVFTCLLVYVSYFYMLDYVQKYSAFGFAGIEDFLEGRADVYADTGSGFDSAAYPYPFRLVLFFLGGLPWHVTSVSYGMAVLEGLVVIGLFIRCVTMLPRALRSDSHAVDDSLIRVGVFSFLYVVLLSAVLTLGATNFGLIARQRVMIYVPLILAYVFLSARSFRSGADP